MPKRRCGERDGGRTAKRRRRHLYLIFDDWSRGYSIRRLCRSPPEQPDGKCSTLERPADGEWPWCRIPLPPLVDRLGVTSYALHSDGRAILVSTESSGATAATLFTSDTGAFVWKQHGEWELPFTGRGYFDRDLDAFVGISKDTESLGHLCSCDATSPDDIGSSRQCPAPAWKLGKEKVFSEDPAERHGSATLVYMGRRSKFCLVECVSIEDDSADHHVLEEEGGVP
ncbi:hypothetical protein BAE44_0020987 [Dichanthelium oligosanthes]|uniref:Uncharacterized protein n=1 Tax=Dichanthelium oligosanthes TaxID=888268 RepID=A0A1E5UYZ4_9POAL|nr:hypothetical protein BAE44_0020987 [Dichanthelium oligosanthes]